jgi:pyridoxine 5-phosphate synthase
MNRRLGVNIDHVATLRQARRSSYPDPIAAAVIAELAGADQITCHLRGDRRHIQDLDLPRLRDAVQTQLNVEIAATPDMIEAMAALLGRHSNWGRQHRVTLVPERDGEVTTEGGLDVAGNLDVIQAAVAQLNAAGLQVSLFVDPDPNQIEACAMPGVDMVELNTSRYCEDGPADLQRLAHAADLSLELGIEVAAGHGLNHHNLGRLVANVPNIVEYNIGHSIIGRAVFVGLDRAVRDIVEIIRG